MTPAPVPPDGEKNPHPFIPGSPGWIAYERGFAAGRAAATPDPPEPRVLADVDMGDDDYEAEARLGIDGAYTCSGCDTIHVPAASPDERLREALTDCAATLMTVAPILEAHVYEPNASGYVWNAWTRWGERAASRIDAALTAADREAPDEETR